MAGVDRCEGIRSDIELMLAAQGDSADAFEALYQRYYRKLQNFFCAMGRNPALAEDLCHETFLRVWKLRKRYAATGSFPAYLFTFARMVWFERCREAKRAQRDQTVQAGWYAEAEQNKGGSPQFSAERGELSALLDQAMNELPEDQKMAFVLRVVDGLPLEDIAKVMQCPVNTVRSRKLLAVRKLRELLGDVLLAMRD